MLRDPFTKWLRDSRRSLLAWSIAIAAVGGMYAAFWPTVDNPDMRAMLETYPSGLMEAINYTDIATPAGYLNATVYGLVVAFLSIVFAVTTGTRLIASDEEAGTLDLILVHPVGRVALALERWAAFMVEAAVISLALMVAILLLEGPARLEGISFGNLLAMHVQLMLFAWFYGAVAFGVGAGTGRRSLAASAGAAMAVFGFAANGILPQVDGLSWIRNLSAFHWLNGGTPLASGLDVGAVLIMATLVLLLVAAGTAAFDRRDLGV